MRSSETQHRRSGRFAVALAAILLGSLATAGAQESEPRCGPEPVRIAAQFLHLSLDQLAAWDDTLGRKQASIRSIRREIALRERRLQDLLAADEPNPVEIGLLVMQISHLRGQIEEIRGSSGEELLATLDDQQLAVVDAAGSAAPLVPAVRSFQLPDLI